MEKKDKNEGWKDILKGAEAVPSDFVWEGVEASLDKTELMQLRRAVVFHRWLAAAGVTFALMASGTAFWWASVNSELRQSGKLTNATKTEPQPGALLEKNTPESILRPSENPTRYQSDNRSEPPAQEQVLLGRHEQSASNEIRFVPSSQQWIASADNFRISNNKYTASHRAPVESPVRMETKPAEANIVENVINKETKKDNKQEERFWTSVGFSAGTYTNATPNGVSKTASSLQSFDAGKTAASETNSPGYTYTVNVGVGTRVSKRIMLVGGISYMSQQSDYTATTVISDQADQTLKPASLNAFEKKAEQSNSSEAILTSTPYKVNNNIQLISFPMQAGYLLIDKRMSLQINSGFSTDLFLQNTITPYADNLEKTTQGRGDDSPYRPVNFSGLLGTEVSYKVAENYRIAVSPGIRYPLNSIYKSDLGVESSPLTFDMAVRFRYIFR